MFHAYFDVDVEELLNGRKLYPCDRFWALVNKGLQRFGLKDFPEKWRKTEKDEHITYQDAYKILKR